MKLFGHPDSGHAFKVKFFLKWLGIEHDYEYVDIFADVKTRSAEFLKASQFSEVPTLIDNHKPYIQSDAILMYLGDKFDVFESDAIRQKNLEWLVWEANKIGMCLPQIRAHEKFGKKYPEMQLSQGAYDWLSNRYEHDVNILNNELEEKPFILGGKINPADFSLCGYLMFADEAKVNVPKNVVTWLDRLRDQKGWQHPSIMLKG